jgi:hypothetical protein
MVFLLVLGNGERSPREIACNSGLIRLLNRFANAVIGTALGTLEHAQTIANHESPRTTKLYDRTREELTAEEIGRIRI